MTTTRKATTADLHSIAQIEKNCFTHPWSENLISDELTHPDAIVTIAFNENLEILGYSVFRKIDDYAELFRIAVDPTYQNQGIGRILFNSGANSVERRRILLEVDETNTPAIALYKSLGFTETGRRPNYYGSHAALLMEYFREDLSNGL